MHIFKNAYFQYNFASNALHHNIVQDEVSILKVEKFN